MPGNSQRKGATRKGASRKGPLVGSGGQRKQGLEGRKPTPKASERTGHPAARRARTAEKRSAAPDSRQGRGGPRTRKDGTELVYGRNPVVEALRAGVPGTTLYVQQSVDTDDRVREALTIAGGTRLPLLEVSRTQLDDMTNRGVHQGLVLAIPPYEYAEPADLSASAADLGQPLLVVALDGVTDPRNLGAVVRSAAAFGAHGVVVPERRAAGVTAAAWKVSAGAAARIPVARATNLTRTLTAYASAGAMIVGLAAGGESLDALDPQLAAGPLVLVVGSEGQGLSRLVAATCDLVVGIPMSSESESLNAGVAAGVALYAVAAARRR
jgi:23S rRNA (guanosine2251-2'-O)-methyltransferase